MNRDPRPVTSSPSGHIAAISIVEVRMVKRIWIWSWEGGRREGRTAATFRAVATWEMFVAFEF